MDQKLNPHAQRLQNLLRVRRGEMRTDPITGEKKAYEPGVPQYTAEEQGLLDLLREQMARGGVGTARPGDEEILFLKRLLSLGPEELKWGHVMEGTQHPKTGGWPGIVEGLMGMSKRASDLDWAYKQ